MSLQGEHLGFGPNILKSLQGEHLGFGLNNSKSLQGKHLGFGPNFLGLKIFQHALRNVMSKT
jgi:hypothetical protein